MKRIIMHVVACMVLLPCMAVFNQSGEYWVNILGVIYCAYLAILWNESETAKRFVRMYYHEILRLENMM